MRSALRQILLSSARGGASAATTLNPLDKSALAVLSNGNLTGTTPLDLGDAGIRATKTRSTGAWHFEATVNNAGYGNGGIGMANLTFDLNTQARDSVNVLLYSANGAITPAGTSSFAADTFGLLSVLAFEVNFGTNQWWVEKLGGTGRKGPFSLGGLTNLYPLLGLNGPGGQQFTMNFGASAFIITPTSGFTAWNG